MQALPGLLALHFALSVGDLLLFAEVWSELTCLWIFWESSSNWNQICQESWVIAMSLFEHRTYLWSSQTFTDHDAEVCSGWNKFMVICQQHCMRASDFFMFTVEGEGPLLLEKREPGKYNVRSKEPLSSTDHSYNFCSVRMQTLPSSYLPDVPVESVNHRVEDTAPDCYHSPLPSVNLHMCSLVNSELP